MSITIIAVTILIGCAWCVLPLLIRAPLFVLGAIITGWTASVIYAVLAAVSLYIGKGLLDLRERARVLAVGWFSLWFLHTVIITLVPSFRQRLLSPAMLPEGQRAAIPFDIGVLFNWSLVMMAITTAAAVWFLSRDRDAFVRAENARDWPGLHT